MASVFSNLTDEQRVRGWQLRQYWHDVTLRCGESDWDTFEAAHAPATAMRISRGLAAWSSPLVQALVDAAAASLGLVDDPGIESIDYQLELATYKTVHEAVREAADRRLRHLPHIANHHRIGQKETTPGPCLKLTSLSGNH